MPVRSVGSAHSDAGSARCLPNDIVEAGLLGSLEIALNASSLFDRNLPFVNREAGYDFGQRGSLWQGSELEHR